MIIELPANEGEVQARDACGLGHCEIRVIGPVLVQEDCKR